MEDGVQPSFAYTFTLWEKPLFTKLIPILFIAICTASHSQQVALEDLSVKETVKWINETPEDATEYVGRVFVLNKNGQVTPHFRSIAVPIAGKDEPTIKKATLVKAQADASVSFAEIVNLKASYESVYQFQIVNERTWYAKARDPAYLEAISKFRNDPGVSHLFTSPDVEAVLFCVGVVQRKVWYKVYRKLGFLASANYMVKVDGSSYGSFEDYEEVVKYGLLIRPLRGFGISLPSVISNSADVDKAVSNPAAVRSTADLLRHIRIPF